jgi:hypothetical protein
VDGACNSQRSRSAFCGQELFSAQPGRTWDMEAPSSRVTARRDRAFFCIVGTLLVMAVVVYQGDHSGYKAALAERSAATENVFERGYKPPLQGHWCGNARHATCTPEDARILHVAPGRRHMHVSR